MNKETSLYLDAVRFLAACTVLLCHVDDFLVKGLIPFVDHLGIEAVGVFFVLSGFVIGYATDTREKDLRTYTINRAARLYSVVIPCLAITFVLDVLGRHFMPANYHGTNFHELIKIFFSLSFLNCSWLLPIPIGAGSNGPFWTLCFEVPYYFLFGTAFFLRGFWRWLIPALGAACAGQYILLLFPIWLLGLGIYWLCRRLNLGPLLGRGIFALSILLWIIFEAILWILDICPDVPTDIQVHNLLLYGSGSCFALSIIGFRFADIRISQFSAPIRWLAGATFTIYLLHFPVACFLANLVPASSPSHERWIIIVSITLCAAFITAHFTERRKQVWRRNIESIFTKAENKFSSRESKLRQS